MEPETKLVGQRWHTLKAAMWLAAARFMVRFLPFSSWNGLLGTLVQGSQQNSQGAKDADFARYWARRVLRASERLPGHSKCLPQAAALQILLRGRLSGSRLVVALHRHRADGQHGLHAWVEYGGEMLIGHCERDEYSPVAIFEQRG